MENGLFDDDSMSSIKNGTANSISEKDQTYIIVDGTRRFFRAN